MKEIIVVRSLHLPHKKLVGTLWSSVAEIQGWQHFVVVGQMQSNSVWQVEMAAVCDKSIRFWIKKKALKNSTVWLPGLRKLG